MRTSGRGAAASALSRAVAANGERNDFHRCDHLAGDDRLVGRQRRDGDRFIDAVEAVDRFLVDDEHAGALRKQIGAAGEGAIDMHAFAGDCLGEVGRRHVFGDIAGLEAGHDDVLDTGRLERGGLDRADQRALFEHHCALADGVHRGGADRLFRRDRSEFHDAALTRGRSAAGSSRSRSVICAMIATAISAGETAPISRPIGAWMRADVGVARCLAA